eukprot:5853521-Alexandrium_andersonii.AAC.1
MPAAPARSSGPSRATAGRGSGCGAAIDGPHVTVAGDCRPVVNYTASFGKLKQAGQHRQLDGALARLVVHGWVVDWRIIPRSLNGKAHALAADGRAGRPCRLVGPAFH